MIDPERYRVAGYAGFRERATDPTLTANEKCGFAEMYRAGFGPAILRDIRAKLTGFDSPGARICDIGAGCSELAQLIVEATARDGQSLTLIDCAEMLSLLPSPPHVAKLEGQFPDCLNAAGRPVGPFDVILVYSVIQTVFAEGDLFPFVDAAAQLLVDGGQLLLGDIPNSAMRKRFMGSNAGRGYHRAHYSHLPEPKSVLEAPEPGEIDDGVVLRLVARMRAAGFHAFILPQSPDLPMATRREDILIVRP